MNDTPLHLLVVDDDERIRTLLQKYLIRAGFLVTIARDAAQARRLLAGLEFDLAILDVMMPGEDGVALTRDLRKTTMMPILLLTARGETAQKIDGFEAGADDYLIKPFEPKELVLRISAILRRAPAAAPSRPAPRVLHMGPVRYDIDRGELWRGGDLVRLTASEAALMRVFSAEAGRPVPRSRLAGGMGGLAGERDLGADLGPGAGPYSGTARAVDVQITRLRRKIEADPKQPRYLQTVRGEGYLLQPD
jgi:two-component system, OmpR family, phosphate regulon response regulator OmpR